MKNSGIFVKTLSSLLALALWLPGPATAAGAILVRTQTGAAKALNIGLPIARVHGGLGGGAFIQGLRLDQQSLGSANPALRGKPGIFSLGASWNQTLAVARPAPLRLSAIATAGNSSLAAAFPAGVVSRSIAVAANAASNPRLAAGSLDRIFDNGKEGKAPDDGTVAADDEAAAAKENGESLEGMPPEAVAWHEEFERAAHKRLADFDAEVSQVKSGDFGIRIQRQMSPQGESLIIRSITFLGQPLDSEGLRNMLETGQFTQDQWRNAEPFLVKAGEGLVSKLAAMLQEIKSEHQAVHRKMARLVQGIFRRVDSPEYFEFDFNPPLNFQKKHLTTLLDKMAGVHLAQHLSRNPQARLSRNPRVQHPPQQEVLMRLFSTLFSIDNRFVDAITPDAWDKAVALMGDTAAKVFDIMKENWDAAVTGMIKAAVEKLLDPFCAYWTQEEFKSFQDLENNTFADIGISLGKDLFIKNVSPRGPAAKAGLMTGDKILAVDGAAMSDLEQTVKALRGEESTPVRVQVERNGQALPEFSMVRAQARTRNILSKLAAPGVGYVYLGQFSPGAETEFFSAVNRLREQGARKLIIDVRGNPDDAVDTASSILASFFKDGQKIVSFKRQGQVLYEHVADGDGRFLDMPVAVLVNGDSASASEVLAGAMQDVRGPVIVGSRTYGKGSMQGIMPDMQGRALKLTLGRWYTPRDRNIDAQRDPETKEKLEGTGGIIPDHLVTLTYEQELEVMRQLQQDLAEIPAQGPRVPDPALVKALELLSQ